MNDYHRQTIHTWESVRSGRGMDWERQPEVFKYYPPEFATVSPDVCARLRNFLHLCCGITAEKVYPGGRYFLRVNPSAGALYPCELYVQSRGESGLVDGIYHFEPLTKRLRLLYVLKPEEGLEGYFHDGGVVNGLVVLVTAVYYRSSWKYGRRALRYCLLDGGHILGAMEAAAYCTARSCSWITRFDRERLQKDFGFSTRELPLVMGTSGKQSSDRVRRPQMGLDYVNGSGVFCRDTVIEQAFAQASSPSVCRRGKGAEVPYSVAKAELKSIILRRRSIRRFSGRPISSVQYKAVCNMIRRNIALDCDEDIEVFSIVHRVEGMESGLYVDDRCLRKGDFAAMAGYLCLEQPLGADGAAIFFLVGDSENYFALMLKAGLLGQRIYLASELQGLGCSGIGAFYDPEVADFLETDSLILYALAIGV